MNTLKATIRNRYVVNIACVGVLFFPLCLTYWSPNSPRSSSTVLTRLTVINRTAKLTVIGTKPLDSRTFELTVRNDYDKIVTSYAYSFNPMSGYHTVEHSIDPGEKITRQVALPQQAFDQEPPILTILAAAFLDYTADGEFRFGRDLIDTQLGEAAQIERVNDLLTQFSREANEDLPSRLARLKSDIENLPDPPQAETSFAFRAAVHDEKKGALERVERLERGYQETGRERFEAQLKGLSANYERRNSSYKADRIRK